MLANLRMSTKLIGAFLIVALIAATIGIVGVFSVRGVERSLGEIGEENLPSLQAIYVIKGAMLTSLAAEQGLGNPHVVSGSIREGLFETAAEEFNEIEGARKEFESLPKTKAESKLWADFAPILEEWQDDHKQIIELAQERDKSIADGVSPTSSAIQRIDAKVSDLVAETAMDLKTINVNMDKVTTEKTNAAKGARSQGKATADMANTSLLLAALLGVALAVVLGLLISRSISKTLDRIITGLTAAAENTSAASAQLSSSSQSVADGTNEQASGLEETSTALQQITGQTQSNADNSRQADQLAREAKSAAENGSASMTELRAAMSEINASAEQVGRILKAIEEIAFQTNLLALNAAVEAARAGEQGKGFAVVAEEVRNLAQRAAGSVKDTAKLVEDSILKAKRGSEITENATTALDGINGSVEKVAELVSEITAASEEQAAGVNQINIAITQMSQVTQSNAAGAEETASAAEQLSSQAVQLQEMVGSLLALVHGGSSNDATGQRTRPRRTEFAQPQGARLSRPALTGASRARNGSQTSWSREPDRALAEIGVRGSGSSTHMAPEDVIPFDSDNGRFSGF